jgi:hypothetical protein
MLDFAELKRLVPLQPHGVLATTEGFEAQQPHTLGALTRSMILASRALHERFEAFEQVIRRHVAVKLSREEARLLWQREHEHGGWAVNGELTRGHWEAQLAAFRALNRELPQVRVDEVKCTRFVADALERLGAHPAAFDKGLDR